MLYESSRWLYLRHVNSNRPPYSNESIKLDLCFGVKGLQQPSTEHKFVIKVDSESIGLCLCLKPLKDLIILQNKDNKKFILCKGGVFGFYSTRQFNAEYKIVL